MGFMTQEEINVGLFDECKRLRADLARVTAEQDAAIAEAQQASRDRAIMKTQLDRAEAAVERLRADITNLHSAWRQETINSGMVTMFLTSNEKDQRDIGDDRYQMARSASKEARAKIDEIMARYISRDAP